MQFLNRDLLDKAKSLVDKFPFLAISEPRQSGKTKLAQMLKPEYQYVNLELPQERNYAKNDPLVGIRNEDDLKIHFARGAVFENLILTEIIKNELNQGLKSNVYYWRDNHQNEVDIIQEKNGKLIAYEIKSSETYH